MTTRAKYSSVDNYSAQRSCTKGFPNMGGYFDLMNGVLVMGSFVGFSLLIWFLIFKAIEFLL